MNIIKHKYNSKELICYNKINIISQYFKRIKTLFNDIGSQRFIVILYIKNLPGIKNFIQIIFLYEF